MKKIHLCAALLVGLSILLVGGMGVDLTYSRVGFGMLTLALSSLLFVFGAKSAQPLHSRRLLLGATLIAGTYFLWRALAGGPPGAAVADAILVAVFLGFYLASAYGGRSVLRLVVICLGISSLANAVMVACQVSSDSQLFLWRDSFALKPMLSGVFGHYNYMAAYLNGSVFLFFALSFYTKKWWLRGLCVLVVFASVACLLASGSRGGWLGFIVGFGVFVVGGLSAMKAAKHSGFGVAIVVSLVALVAGIITARPVIQELTNRRAGIEEISGEASQENAQIHDGGRIYFQQLAFEMFQDSPVIGHGPRSFSYLALKYWDPEEHSIWNNNPVFAHNEYLQAMSDYGLIGVGLIIVLLFGYGILTILSLLFERGSHPAWLIPLKIGALGGVAAMAAQGFFSFVLHLPACAMVVGLLMGILVLDGKASSPSLPGVKFLRPIASLLIASVLGFLGERLTRSFLLYESGQSRLQASTQKSETIKALDQLKESATIGFSSDILEDSARQAMEQSTKAREANDLESEQVFAQIALDHLLVAQDLDPHSSVALVMVPHVYDLMGHFPKANQYYELAMERLKVREPFLKPHLYAARSRYGQGLLASDKGEGQIALAHFRKSHHLIEKRTEVLNAWREAPADKLFRLELEARIALLEGEALYWQGDRVWKQARPRNPELAYALMQSAAMRYRQAEDFFKKEPRSKWAAQWTQLQENLELLKLVGTKPVELSQEAIADFINQEAGLDPSSRKR